MAGTVRGLIQDALSNPPYSASAAWPRRWWDSGGSGGDAVILKGPLPRFVWMSWRPLCSGDFMGLYVIWTQAFTGPIRPVMARPRHGFGEWWV